MHYRGRFAPSPTGPLHFGSLVAAVASYLEARARSGAWLVRIDDLDPPRVVPGAARDILHSLRAFGFEWDGAVVYQSARADAYHAALHRLRAAGAVYPCACSRREIADSAADGIEGPVYPGTCRAGLHEARAARALRVRTDAAPIAFVDGVQGPITQQLVRDIGDFVVYRADHVFAYQLAVVVDDAEQGITDVVRGADLLLSTPRQIHLQRLLGLPTPHYVHAPVAVNAEGQKLSKQTLALAVDPCAAVTVLAMVLDFLGQPVAPAMRRLSLAAFWREAIARWQLERVPRLLQRTAPPLS
ncbi:MAG: tRNA glutamyl-Q(34) synthetase GluQRS [Betaproteobacteria bacterium]|nr:tRNA glutamyl-Q(34) synthetase GluQRS [Betaproteobacteria bacterium]